MSVVLTPSVRLICGIARHSTAWKALSGQYDSVPHTWHLPNSHKRQGSLCSTAPLHRHMRSLRLLIHIARSLDRRTILKRPSFFACA
jgi:hypothetical protein